jgi:hypothetical protein
MIYNRLIVFVVLNFFSLYFLSFLIFADVPPVPSTALSNALICICLCKALLRGGVEVVYELQHPTENDDPRCAGKIDLTACRKSKSLVSGNY